MNIADLKTDLDVKIHDLERWACKYESHAQALRQVIERYRIHGLPYAPTTQNHQPNL